MSSPLRLDSAWGPFTLLLNRYLALLGIGRLACEVDYTSPSSAEVKNEWSPLYTFIVWAGTTLPLPYLRDRK